MPYFHVACTVPVRSSTRELPAFYAADTWLLREELVPACSGLGAVRAKDEGRMGGEGRMKGSTQVRKGSSAAPPRCNSSQPHDRERWETARTTSRRSCLNCLPSLTLVISTKGVITACTAYCKGVCMTHE